MGETQSSFEFVGVAVETTSLYPVECARITIVEGIKVPPAQPLSQNKTTESPSFA